MDILLRTHKQLERDDFKELWEKGTFIFDTNVIFDLYRLPKSAKNDLLKILSDPKLSQRIWLPFQIFLEISQNRINVIGEQKRAFKKVEKILNAMIVDINSAFNTMCKNLGDLNLDKRHSIIDPDPFLKRDLIEQPINELLGHIKELQELEEKQPDIIDKDSLQGKILEIFADKIGSSYKKEELAEIYKEGEQRYKDDIPPGYKDKDKESVNTTTGNKEFTNTVTGKKEPDFYLYEDKKILRIYGDLIFWKEIIKKAQDDKLEFIVLITNEKKEGWLQEKNGKTLGVRYELLNEIYTKAKSVKLFHIYDSPNFMKYAKEFLKIDITEKSITETEELLRYSKKIHDRSDFYESIKDQFRRIVEKEDEPFFTSFRFSFVVSDESVINVQEIRATLRDCFPVLELKLFDHRSEYFGEISLSRALSKREIEERTINFRFVTDVEMQLHGLDKQ